MIIVETCPKCGHDLRSIMICTYPPIPRKECFHCGWSWEGKREEIVRVPFGGDVDTCNLVLNSCLNASCDITCQTLNLSNKISND